MIAYMLMPFNLGTDDKMVRRTVFWSSVAAADPWALYSQRTTTYVRLIDSLSAVPRDFAKFPLISWQGRRYTPRYGLLLYKVELLRK
jgi:hypothetical protein